MNKILEVLEERERSKNWLAKKLGISHQSLEYKIKHDTFTPFQQLDAAFYLDKTTEALFPDTIAEVQS